MVVITPFKWRQSPLGPLRDPAWIWAAFLRELEAPPAPTRRLYGHWERGKRVMSVLPLWGPQGHLTVSWEHGDTLNNLFLESESCSVMSDSLRPHGLYSPWNSPGQNTGVGSLSLLQGIFPTQGSNPGLPHCRRILYQLSHKRSPRILEWVAYPFSRGFSWPRNRTRVSCIAGRFFTNWTIREAVFLEKNRYTYNWITLLHAWN